jgi:hypothetical protein
VREQRFGVQLHEPSMVRRPLGLVQRGTSLTWPPSTRQLSPLSRAHTRV